jgi:acyl-CoA thioester hydrolase
MSAYHQVFTVRWSDCDANGHMANTTYSELATETRIGYLASRGWSFAEFQAARFGPVILREELDYLREVRMGEALTVDFTVLGLSKDEARFKLAHEVLRDGKKVARVVLVGGWMDLTRRKLAPPPARLAEILRELPRGEPFDVLPDAGQAGEAARVRGTSRT